LGNFYLLEKFDFTDKILSPDSSGNPFLLGFESLILTKRDAKKIATDSGK